MAEVEIILMRSIDSADAVSTPSERIKVQAAYTSGMPETAGTFGDRLRAAREEARLSQDSAALDLGITKGAMSAWENDKNFPQLETFAALCRLYRQSADYLLFGVEGALRLAEEHPPYLSQTMSPADLSMAIQLANEKIASAGLAPTPEQYGQFVLQLYGVLEGGLPDADVHDIRSGALADSSIGDRHERATRNPASQGQQAPQPAIGHDRPAARKPGK